MSNDELQHIVTEFREGILDGRSSVRMCLAVCAALEGYLRFCGIETHAVAGTIQFDNYEQEHFWLEMENGAIIDPTADQFEGLNMPPVYIGSLPERYIRDAADS